eukprot:CAMPEP_0174249920 /NCGR_PEP_ID=MMETSP0439-20130205/248_1 /TAXON_ID=0 /ORGANISM="Stereomyxa ramosa, Strain Chinc5" /LENGTH=461 /DNA_ID=CAMNT_0015329865 /DNA_START=15 /DNA_END=1400 /DNA_ORIENTATION=+
MQEATVDPVKVDKPEDNKDDIDDRLPGKKEKVLTDFSKEVDEALPSLVEMGKQDLDMGIESLLDLEKKTRGGEDSISTSRVANAILDLCFEAKEFEKLNEMLVVLSKRRGQLKTVIKKMVERANYYLEHMPDKSTKEKLIRKLRLITEGKIFVEVEHARLTLTLAELLEAKGDLMEAKDIMLEEQVETIVGSMEADEKIDFILKTLRLCLEIKDYTRAYTVAKKITPKALAKEEYQELKLRYYELVVQVLAHEKKNLEICKAYRAMYDTKIVQDEKKRWTEILKLIVVYIVLSPHDNEQHDLLHRIYSDKHLMELEAYRKLLKAFTRKAIIRWPILEAEYGPVLSKLPIFAQDKTMFEELHSRVVEHNIMVISKYYQRITMERFSMLLDLSIEEAERHISNMVSSHVVWARLNRPEGIVSFTPRKDPNEILNSWSHDIKHLLNLLEKTCHLIQRENMVHNL